MKHSCGGERCFFMSAPRGDKAHPQGCFSGNRPMESGTSCQHPPQPVPGAVMRLMLVPPFQPRLQVRGTCPSASGFAIPLQARGEPLAGTGGCAVLAPVQPSVSHQPHSPDTCSATCQPHQLSWVKATPQGLLLPHSHSSSHATPPRSCWPTGL